MDEIMALDNMKEYVKYAGPHPCGSGAQIRLRFPNGYGASIIRTPYSYGGREGLFELAVLKYGEEDDDWSLNYGTPITDDVKGYLSAEEVLTTLKKIFNLPIVEE